MTSEWKRLLGALLCALMVHATLPVTVWAQGMEFDEDEVLEFGEDEVLEFDENEAIEFGEDEVAPVEEAPSPSPSADAPTAATRPQGKVTALIVPSPAVGPQQADEITAFIAEQIATYEGIEVVPNDGLRQEFEIMGSDLALECAFDPVCIGRYGQRLGLDYVVVGRVEANDKGKWGTTVDLFDSASSSIDNYRFFETDPDMTALRKALPAQLKNLFGIRPQKKKGPAVAEGRSTLQTVAAWSTLGLGVASLGVGIFYGAQARATQDDLLNGEIFTVREDLEGYELSQADAKKRIDEGESQALLANIFIGAGAALTITSLILFSVTTGSDIDEDADAELAGRPGWRMAPVAGADRFGFLGEFRF